MYRSVKDFYNKTVIDTFFCGGNNVYMKQKTACLLCLLLLISVVSLVSETSAVELYRVNKAGLKNSSQADIGLMVKAMVIKHVDGDTVRVQIFNHPDELNAEETIRLLGVDTPETVRPNQPAQPFGKEASDFTMSRLLGRDVYLAFDWDLRDRYGRLLAYIYTDSGLCFNALLIREGFGYAYLQYPFQFMEEFKALEQEARQQKRGLWY